MRMEVNDEELKKLEKLEKQEGNRNWMTINLKENERLDELRNGYQIIQNPEKFCFGMDAVLIRLWKKQRKGIRRWISVPVRGDYSYLDGGKKRKQHT